MKKIQELLDSPYFRIKFSYYQQGKFYSQGNIYLYLPHEFDENKIIDFVRRKFKIYLKNTFPNNEAVRRIDNFLLEDFIPVKREQ